MEVRTTDVMRITSALVKWTKIIFLVYFSSGLCTSDCILREQVHIDLSIEVPAYLTDTKRRYEACEEKSMSGGMMYICEPVSSYRIRSGCMCTVYHLKWLPRNTSLCYKEDNGGDNIYQMNCSDCIRFSENKKGPCMHGKPMCEGEAQLAKDIKCMCDVGYTGDYCEMEEVQVDLKCSVVKDALDLDDCSHLVGLKDCRFHNTKTNTSYRCRNPVMAEGNMDETQSCTYIGTNSDSMTGDIGSGASANLMVSPKHWLFLAYSVLMLKNSPVNQCAFLRTVSLEPLCVMTLAAMAMDYK